MGMTLNEIHERVQEIFMARFDDEKAHGLEDTLRHDVLMAIAYTADPAIVAELASAVLRTSEIEFSRWTA